MYLQLVLVLLILYIFSFITVSSIGLRLDAISVPLPGSEFGKYVEKNPRKSQVISRIFRLWSSEMSNESIPAFLGRILAKNEDR